MLSILGCLYYRIGRLSNAATVFAALDKLTPEGMGVTSRRVAATFAAIETDHGNAEKALQPLHRAMDGQTLSTRHTALYLSRACVLWQQGRKDEAGVVVNEYLHLVDNGPSAQALAEPPFSSMDKRV